MVMFLGCGALAGCGDEPMSPTTPSAVTDGSMAQASGDPGRGRSEPQSPQSATSDVSSGLTVGGLSVLAAAQRHCPAASSPTSVEATIGTRGTVRLDWTHDHNAGEYVHNRSSSGTVCRRARVAGFNIEWQRTDRSGFGASSGDPTVERTGTYTGVPGQTPILAPADYTYLIDASNLVAGARYRLTVIPRIAAVDSNNNNEISNARHYDQSWTNLDFHYNPDGTNEPADNSPPDPPRVTRGGKVGSWTCSYPDPCRLSFTYTLAGGMNNVGRYSGRYSVKYEVWNTVTGNRETIDYNDNRISEGVLTYSVNALHTYKISASRKVSGNIHWSAFGRSISHTPFPLQADLASITSPPAVQELRVERWLEREDEYSWRIRFTTPEWAGGLPLPKVEYGEGTCTTSSFGKTYRLRDSNNRNEFYSTGSRRRSNAAPDGREYFVGYPPASTITFSSSATHVAMRTWAGRYRDGRGQTGGCRDVALSQ